MKKYKHLKNQRVDLAKAARLLAREGDEDLLRAVHNPDHSPAGTEAIRSILADRGFDEGQVASYRSRWEDLHVPPFGKPPSHEEARRRPGRWRLIYRSIQAASLALFVLFGFITEVEKGGQRVEVGKLIASGAIDEMVEDGYIDGETFRPYRGLATLPDEVNEEILGLRAQYRHDLGLPSDVRDLSGLRPLEGLCAFALVVLFGFVRVLAWGEPARILLLRPFGAREVSRSLRRLVRRNVLFLGHIFTLCDVHM